MVIIKANADSEAGKMPSEALLTAMGTFNEELVKAGVMLAGEGLQSSTAAKESNEQVGGRDRSREVGGSRRGRPIFSYTGIEMW
jgi:hypothetical protein